MTNRTSPRRIVRRESEATRWSAMAAPLAMILASAVVGCSSDTADTSPTGPPRGQVSPPRNSPYANQTAGAGGTSTMSAGGSTTAGGSPSSTEGAGGTGREVGFCDTDATPDTCDGCLAASCCDAQTACAGSIDCAVCTTSALSGDCNGDSSFAALHDCAAASCSSPCAPELAAIATGSAGGAGGGGGDSGGGGDAGAGGDSGGAGGAAGGPVDSNTCAVPDAPPSAGACAAMAAFSCNPVTGDGCNADETCDADIDAFGVPNGFRCFPPPNTAALCGACDVTSSFCGVGLTCLEGSCARYCCTDQDCGTGTCTNGLAFPAGDAVDVVGVCRSPGSGGAGGAGNAGAGGTGASGTGGGAGAAGSAGSAGAGGSS